MLLYSRLQYVRDEEGTLVFKPKDMVNDLQVSRAFHRTLIPRLWHVYSDVTSKNRDAAIQIHSEHIQYLSHLQPKMTLRTTQLCRPAGTISTPRSNFSSPMHTCLTLGGTLMACLTTRSACNRCSKYCRNLKVCFWPARASAPLVTSQGSPTTTSN